MLDERRYLDSNLLGERIYAKPGFRFVAATNTVDLAAQSLPEFIRSRLRPQIEVGFPPREQIDRMVRQRFPRLDRLNGEGGSSGARRAAKHRPRRATRSTSLA